MPPLPPGLPAYEFQRVLTPSRDLPHYFHLRLLKDEGGAPALVAENAPRPKPIDVVEFFGAPSPIEIEVGCGKGTFLLAYCERHPETPFLALEKEAAIAYLAAGRLAKRPQIPHARVVLGEAQPFFRDFLPDSCARAVHIYFPDPWPKKRHHKHRLMDEDFLDQVRRVCLPNARLYFGTDHADYDAATRELFARTPWLEMLDAQAVPTEGIETNFEIKYRRAGKAIYRCALRVQKNSS
jgi:tRNA (guanine-N7-)-methyltransferase